MDIRSDLYSLGCTFFFALTGRPPFGGQSVMEKLANHLMEPPPPVTRLRRTSPSGVAAIVLQLMAKDPNQRFQTPIALARALRPYCSTSQAASSSALGPARELPPRLASLHARAPGTAISARDSGTRVVVKEVAHQGPEEQRADGAEAAAATPTRVLAPETSLPAADGTSAAPVRTAPTEGKSGASADRLLHDALALWTGVVSSIYHRQGRGNWKESDYRRLHEGLLSACQRGESVPAERRVLFRRLHAILQPWVSLDSLERTEPELLSNLLAQGRQLERDLGVRRSLGRKGRWILRFRCVSADLLADFPGERSGLALSVG